MNEIQPQYETVENWFLIDTKPLKIIDQVIGVEADFDTKDAVFTAKVRFRNHEDMERFLESLEA